MLYQVIIKYGTWFSDRIYAETPSHTDAKRLQRTAIAHGYPDARIEKIATPQGVSEAACPLRRSARRAEGVGRQARPVPDLRALPSASLAV